MKMPKSFNKLTAAQQETLLVKKYQDALSEVDAIKRMLGKVRGGQKIFVDEQDDRPDLIDLKK